MIYLYAITEPEVAVPETTGLEGHVLALASAPPVAGLYSEHDQRRFDPTPDVLWQHDAIVEAAMRQGPVLPARFGTTFADTSALCAVLERDGARLQDQLKRLRGCVELAVRVTAPGFDASPSSDGLQYVQAKLATRRARRALVEQTLGPLASHALGSHTPGLASDPGTLTASFLVRAGDVEGFADRVRMLAERHSELVFSCTGPWPPYSFAQEGA